MANYLVGGDSCAPCCWRVTAACPDVLRLSMDFAGPPIPPPTISIWPQFNGEASAGVCTLGPYVTVVSSGTPRTWNIDVWRAFRDGAWTSSVTVAIYSRSTTPNIDFGPLNDTALSCWQNFVYVGALDSCVAPGVPVATITILDDGTMSIA